jgi:hypothetical protein
MIETSEAAVVADFRLRTVGLEEGVRSPQASVSICVTCTDLMAKGDEPNERTRPLDHLVFTLVQEMVSNDPSFAFLSWIALRKGRGLPVPTLIEPKILKAWTEFRKVMALPALIERNGEAAPAKQLKEAS